MKLVEDGDVTGAARAMGALFDLSAAQFGVRVCRVPDALDLELRLLAAGDVEAARTLHESFSRWLLATASEARMVRDRSAAHLTVLRELFAMPPDFDGRVRRAIAIATRAGDFKQAAPTLEALRQREPKLTRAQAELVRRGGPTLAAHFALMLDEAPFASIRRSLASKPAPQKPAKRASGALIAVSIAFAAMFHFLNSDHRSSSPKMRETYAPTPTLTFAVPTPLPPPPPAPTATSRTTEDFMPFPPDLEKRLYQSHGGRRTLPPPVPSDPRATTPGMGLPPSPGAPPIPYPR
jgi:hypothetical protein